MKREMFKNFALLGAQARLAQLRQEEQAIFRAYPALRKGGVEIALGGGSSRRTISKAARKAMSAGMRKFWAKRRATTRAKKTAAKTE